MKAENFYPLALTRPVDELICGAATIGAKKRSHPVEHIWDLIKYLGQDLEEDIKDGKMERWKDGKRGTVHSTVVILNEKNVLIEEGAEIEPYAVLDARQGPIYIGKKTIIKPHAYLRGPLYIGPECRIGGEVSDSIFHGYSNKAHYGFIGHSYIGQWVNLGAGTTCSNLKNTYGTVKVNGIDTGTQFLGCFVGDHAKTGIGTLINTGTVIGVGANVLGGSVTPKNIPNFTWKGKEKYKLDKFLEVAAAVMKRRGVELSAKEIETLKKVYKQAQL
ncbi:hypothetical protein ACFL31_04685 [Candidatus Margulisiibacteriota bacterium]